MAKDLRERVVQLKTDKDLVFSVPCDCHGISKLWEFFYDGEIKKVPGAYVSGSVAEPIRQLYNHFRDSTPEEARKDIHYEHKLQRLVDIARDEHYHGKNGYAWILVNKDGQYDLRLHRIVQAEVLLRKKLSHVDLPKAEAISSEEVAPAKPEENYQQPQSSSGNGHTNDLSDVLPWPNQKSQEGLAGNVQSTVGPHRHDPMRAAGLPRNAGR